MSDDKPTPSSLPVLQAPEELAAEMYGEALDDDQGQEQDE